MSSKPLIVAALGSRGTGKSAWARQWIERARPARLAVWDLMQEHDWAGPAVSSLREAILAMKAASFSVRFAPSRDDKRRAAEFEVWCEACLEAGRLTAYVEELAFVTTPSHAPAAWRSMCLLGRHEKHQVTIVATSQRPAQVDKEFLGNADLVHCGRLRYEADARSVAGMLGVPYLGLQVLPDLHWVERGASDTQPRRGVLNFSAPRKVARPPSGTRPKARNLPPG